MDLKKHYDDISKAAALIREKSLADAAPIIKAHEAVDELRVWQQSLESRPEAALFSQIISALELGLFALVSGLYRQAYGSLRLAVELTAGVSWFSTQRLHLEEWEAGESDLIWKDLTNPDNGILSPRFRKAFFPELEDELKYNGLYKKLYRELSEYVHGGAKTWTGPDDVKFDEKSHKTWFEKLATYMIVAGVLLSLRYLQELSVDSLKKLGPMLLGRVGHVAAIKSYIDAKLPPPAEAHPAGVASKSEMAAVPDPPVRVAPKGVQAPTEGQATAADTNGTSDQGK